MINGDKPIIRWIGGTIQVYGTPWCGKEGWNVNTSAPLKAICFLERGHVNKIRKLPSQEVMKALVHQIIMPKQADLLSSYLELIDHMVTSIPCYHLHCNRELEAAQVAYEGMN